MAKKTHLLEGNIPDFHPHHIRGPTFRNLLNSYRATVEAAARRKATERIARSSSATSRKTEKPKLTPPSQNKRDCDAEQKVESEVKEFLHLDELRYSSLPDLVKERTASGGAGCGFLEKEELIRLMEWKLKHGVFRPMLLGMVKSNPEKVVRQTTSEAFSAVSGSRATVARDDEADEFPKSTLEKLSRPLRGVGPATASLLLSVGTGSQDPKQEVPFYSDDTFLWLCMEVYPRPRDLMGQETGGKDTIKKNRHSDIFKPNGEINVKYNMQEYRMLWNAVKELQTRLNSAELSDKAVSCADIEKVAFVLRHIDLSGYNEQGESNGSSSRKRKRKDII
ncbi:uncharacterized protein ATNIH1004_001090 [Aspergillus tanneri]|uniref:Uncharacterized protein n=1 Tax=Aspergillus tanneri TaxID=1220188 RepID=A0A5M9N1M2_9EURO|nr:uncharacterized protein ATNIH1004_001090 [Aspergillus tanneri]KAA8652186.1 hypothetical protein ATNIH1004_001090 [Aspergillus tanneri]